MVRAASLIASCLLALSTAGCQQREASTNTANVTVPLDAKGVIERLSQAGLPVTNVRTVDERTDPNKLLGRPNQYSSKAFFTDKRHMGTGTETTEQNTVEVFESAADAEARATYIEGVTKAASFLAQYVYQDGRTVLRLNHALLPSEALQYKSALTGKAEPGEKK